MRGTFARTLAKLAETDDRIYLLTGDLGYMALDPFFDRFPERFINVGVAEQNMIGIATGLAESGLIPFCYSIVTFASLRPYEFIRNGPVLHQLPVRIVGVGGGVEYGHNGLTHYGLEDVAVMRAQPALTVLVPADAAQTASILERTYDLAGPIYYRLGKDDRAQVQGLNGQFEIGQLQVIRSGSQIALLSMGAISEEAASAASELESRGISCAHAIVASINPRPTDLAQFLGNFSEVLTVEAHYASGGLFSLVAETVAENGLRCKVNKLAINQMPDGITGSQAYLHQKFGISPEYIVQRGRLAASGVRQ